MEKRKTLPLLLVVLLLLIAAGTWYYWQKQNTSSAPPPPDAAMTGDQAEDSGSSSTPDQSTKAETQTTEAFDENTTKSRPEQQAVLRVPTFDVLRVEPDGTAVIAGAAEPLGELDVKENDDTLVSSKVTAEGNFVAIIDTPLKPGDHLIYLQLSMPDGRTVRSEQTATISIPETSNGELLAVITEPGKASELVNTPKPKQTAMPQTNGNTMIAENQKDQESADAEQTTMSSDNGAPVQSQNTELPPVTVNTGDETTGDAATSQAREKPVAPTVRIKAVEIEGDTLFIAGEGLAGARVRGYLDDTFLSESEVNVESNFVLEKKVSVPVGLHTVRADMLDDDNNVIARAVVPFDRPEGDQIAAVSSTEGQQTETGSDGTQTFVQPQLTKSDNAVIIRRGDNLWRISRRFYGRGVRYTTIYLANEPQIANPNVILPGQVFSLPPEPLPIGEAESIHRRLLSGEHVGPDALPPADR